MTAQKSMKVGVKAYEMAAKLSEAYGIPMAQVIDTALRKLQADTSKSGELCIPPINTKKLVAVGINHGHIHITNDQTGGGGGGKSKNKAPVKAKGKAKGKGAGAQKAEGKNG